MAYSGHSGWETSSGMLSRLTLPRDRQIHAEYYRSPSYPRNNAPRLVIGMMRGQSRRATLATKHLRHHSP